MNILIFFIFLDEYTHILVLLLVPAPNPPTHPTCILLSFFADTELKNKNHKRCGLQNQTAIHHSAIAWRQKQVLKKTS